MQSSTNPLAGENHDASVEITPLRIALCGEVSSGKSSVLRSLIPNLDLPDLFGVDHDLRPIIRVRTSANVDRMTLMGPQGTIPTISPLTEITAELGLTEIIVETTAECAFGPSEIIEFPPLRDAHVPSRLILEIDSCDLFIWTTIGSQAWRLSEKTILDKIGSHRPNRSALVISRADTLRSQTDAEKILSRVIAETKTYFDSCFLARMSPEDISLAAGGANNQDTTGLAPLSTKLAIWRDELSTLEHPDDDTQVSDDDANGSSSLSYLESEHRKKRRVRRLSRMLDLPGEQEGFDDEEIFEAERRAQELQAAKAEPVEEPSIPTTHGTPVDKLLEKHSGVLAAGEAQLGSDGDIDVIYGDDETGRKFANFCVSSADSLLRIAGFGGTDPNPESEQVALTNHHLLYRVKDDTAIFLVCDNSKMSAGIARTSFLQLCELRGRT